MKFWEIKKINASRSLNHIVSCLTEWASVLWEKAGNLNRNVLYFSHEWMIIILKNSKYESFVIIKKSGKIGKNSNSKCKEVKWMSLPFYWLMLAPIVYRQHGSIFHQSSKEVRCRKSWHFEDLFLPDDKVSWFWSPFMHRCSTQKMLHRCCDAIVMFDYSYLCNKWILYCLFDLNEYGRRKLHLEEVLNSWYAFYSLFKLFRLSEFIYIIPKY